MKDVPSIFNGKFVFIDLTKQKDQLLSKLQAKELGSADIVIADVTLAVDITFLRSDVILAVLNSKLLYKSYSIGDDKVLTEPEYLAKSGFLSVVGLA